MTAGARHIIEDFESLPDQDKREVLVELIRMSRHIDYPTIADGELLSAADEVFLDCDSREATNRPAAPQSDPPAQQARD